MAKLKVKLLVGRSGDDFSYSPGDTLDLPLEEAVRLVEAGSAVPANKKGYAEALAKAKEAEEERARIEEENRIRLERESYELRLLELYGQVVDLEASLAGVRLDEAERAKLIKELEERETKAGSGSDK